MRSSLWMVAVWMLAASVAPQPPRSTALGQGPTLVLVHTLGASPNAWMPTVRKLLGSHRVVLVDLPGHGQSPLPDPFSLEVAAEALGQVLAAQKPESTIVVGQGTGGVLALLAVAAHPERARGLVLVDASLRFEPRIPEQQQRFFLRFLDERYDEFLRGTFTRMGRDSAQGVLLHAQAAQVPPPTIKAYIRESLRFDGTRAFQSLKRPVLYLGTSRTWPDTLAWPAVAKQRGFERADALPARRIADSGVLVASERPDSLAALLSEFTARTLAGQ